MERYQKNMTEFVLYVKTINDAASILNIITGLDVKKDIEFAKIILDNINNKISKNINLTDNERDILSKLRSL